MIPLIATNPADAPGNRPRPAREPEPRRVPLGERVLAGLAAAGLLAVLVVAASLAPDPDGHGTHTRLGLPPCGWLLATGAPCPTCGMTTAFAATANRDYLHALRSQPFGFALALGTAAAFWGALHVAVFGSRVGRVAGRLLRPRLLWGVAGAWALSWAYLIATWPAP